MTFGDARVSQPLFKVDGYCPVCEAGTEFKAYGEWLRDYLVCGRCGSVPRERALALMLIEHAAEWRSLAIHESSPAERGVSPKLRRECRRYTATQYFPDRPAGTMIQGFRNENLERQTFASGSFDIVVSLDVMEHVNEPELCFKEIHRTLKPGGLKIFTAPTYKHLVASVRRARYLPDGSIEHLVNPPEYHANPVDPKGSLVTFHYGYDLPSLIRSWAPFDVRVSRFDDPHHGIMGEFTEVYVCRRRAG